MLGRKQDDVALLVKRLRPIAVAKAIERVEYRQVQLIGIELGGELVERALGHRDLDTRALLPEMREKPGQAARPDGRQDTKTDRLLLEQPKALRDRFGDLGLFQDAREVRLHPPTKLGQLKVVTFAAKQRTAEMGLELLDRRRQGRLRHRARLGRAGEVEGPRRRKKIADLVHFHRALPTTRDAP